MGKDFRISTDLIEGNEPSTFFVWNNLIKDKNTRQAVSPFKLCKYLHDNHAAELFYFQKHKYLKCKIINDCLAKELAEKLVVKPTKLQSFVQKLKLCLNIKH